MKYDQELIGNRIKEKRAELGWSQSRLGKALNVSGKQISNYEKNVLIPPMDLLLNMCNVFDCELGFLLGEEEYSSGTRLDTIFENNTCLDIDAVKALLEIIGVNNRNFTYKWEPKRYEHVINGICKSPHLGSLIETFLELEDNTYRHRNAFKTLEKKYSKETIKEALEVNEYEDEDIREEVVDAKRMFDKAEKKQRECEYAIKIARYELNEFFQMFVNDLYPRD